MQFTRQSTKLLSLLQVFRPHNAIQNNMVKIFFIKIAFSISKKAPTIARSIQHSGKVLMYVYCSDANIQKNQHVNNGNLVLNKIYKLTHHFSLVSHFLYNQIFKNHFLEKGGALNAFIHCQVRKLLWLIIKNCIFVCTKIKLYFYYLCGDM